MQNEEKQGESLPSNLEVTFGTRMSLFYADYWSFSSPRENYQGYRLDVL